MKRLFFLIALSSLISCTANKSIKHNDKNYIMPPMEETIDRTEEGFNGGKAFAISINTALSTHPKQFNQLCKSLHKQNLIKFIAFEEFQNTESDTLNLMIGVKVNLDIAQTVVKVFSEKSSLPVVITSTPITEDFFYSHERIYIGGISSVNFPAVNKGTIKALLKAKNLVEFHQLIPSSK